MSISIFGPAPGSLLDGSTSCRRMRSSQVVVEQLSHSAFALTDPGVRISRTRLFPRVTRV
ncbi:hypothetical protein [Mesorhizobium sp. L-8-3]|uniref:hypothetical protein n=1 Tax=Mesorhizobium sp. L-8-3 TaxID=2744522 RepID=UPI0019269251|nr:hypothetical protein [Mesorhizobium sp. L-8-3]